MPRGKRKLPAGSSSSAATSSLNESTSTSDPVPAKSLKKSHDSPTEMFNTNPGLKLGTVLDSMEPVEEDGSEEPGNASEPSATSLRSEQLTLDFSSSELPKQVGDTLDNLLRKTADLQELVNRWIKMSPAERSIHFSDPLEEERISLWIMNALVSLGEVYCRLQGLDPEKEGFDKRKDLLTRYAFKFEELEPHSHLLSRTESGPTARLDMPAVKRFLKTALVEDTPPAEVSRKTAESSTKTTN